MTLTSDQTVRVISASAAFVSITMILAHGNSDETEAKGRRELLTMMSDLMLPETGFIISDVEGRRIMRATAKLALKHLGEADE